MNTNKLIPGVSTHFRWLGGHSYLGLTIGEIYKILEWKNDFYIFLDDTGRRIVWYGQGGTEDASYETNLKEILE